MSGYGLEATDLAKNNGALVINMGTLNTGSVENYLQALRAYNEAGNPVVFDPVGAAATQERRNAVKQLMAGGYFDLIKGNESELKHIYGRVPGRQVGVDSGPSTMGNKEKAIMVRELALRESKCHPHFSIHAKLSSLCDDWRIPVSNPQLTQLLGCTVLLTGPVDYLSDGHRVITIRNGHELLGQITGVSRKFLFLSRNHPVTLTFANRILILTY